MQCSVFEAYQHTKSQFGITLVVYFRVFATITFGGQALGRISALAPDAGKAQLAAAKLFALFDRKTAIDSADQSGKQPVSNI